MANHPFGGNGVRPLGEASYANLHARLLNWDREDLAFKSKVIDAALKNQYDGFINYYAAHAQLHENGSPTFDLICNANHSAVLGYVFKRSFVPNPGSNVQPVDFYGSCWSIHGSVVKESTYGAMSGGAPTGTVGDYERIIESRRHGTNRLLKHYLVEWGLTDAALYVGSLRGEFEFAVAKAMDRLAEDLRPGDRVAVVTSSLGSAIAYNALLHIMNSDNIDGQVWRWSVRAQNNLDLFFNREAQKTRAGPETRIAFYMFANQYGLLSPATEVGSTPASPHADITVAKVGIHPAATLGKVFHRAPIQLIAFTDPDDLLSFPLSSSPRSNVKVRNVYVNNNRMAIELMLGPVPLISATNPLAAHLGYDKNPQVFRVMYGGLPRID